MTGPLCPLQKRLSLFGPPHDSVALPVQAMLQSEGSAASVAPGAIFESQTGKAPQYVIYFYGVLEFGYTHNTEMRIQFRRKGILGRCSS